MLHYISKNLRRVRHIAIGAVMLAASAGSAFAQDQACGSTSWDLTAGQTMPAGTVTVSNDLTNIYIEYDIDTAVYPNAEFRVLHVWVGSDLSNLPVSRGSGAPVPGQFPYKFDATGLTNYTFTIPFSDLSIVDVSTACPLSLFVVPHAEIDLDVTDNDQSHETAFGGNIPGEGRRWWFYGQYEVCCDPNDPPSDRKCETAFAKGTHVFARNKSANPENLPSLDLVRDRWGWAINLTAPTDPGGEVYEIWSGAGLNQTSKGTLVGSVTVVWDGSDVSVTYNLVDHEMDELHIYVGDSPPTTVAPGQYGYSQYFDPAETSHTYTFSDVTDSDQDGIWIIAHAVTCDAR